MATRRRFVVQAAALGAAPFISTRVTRALAAAAERKLGFALCGLGSLSTDQIAPALRKTAHCRLAGIITGTPAKAARWQAQYNIPARNIYNYETMHRIADNADIDVVYVVTPNAIHLENALVAAQAGKHVFCEKPMEISVERCRQMIDALKAANRLLGIGYRCRFEPHHLECMALARQRQFGAVKVIRVLAEQGWFGLDPAFNYGGLKGLRSDGRAINPDSRDQFAVEMDDFARCILEKTPTRVPGEEGLRDVKIMMALYESARSGRPVALG